MYVSLFAYTEVHDGTSQNSISSITGYFKQFDKDQNLIYIYSTKKVKESQKTMQHKNTKANNYSIFIYSFRYMSSVEKNVYFSLLAPIPLLWHSVN